MYVDSDGNLSLTYDVGVYSSGKRVLSLGNGYSAVSRFADIADAGIPEATELEELWANNYKVRFTGSGLRAFLEKNYPEVANELQGIDPDAEYLIDCYDMS